MEKEIMFRLFRIIMVIVFVLILSVARNNVKASYDTANKIKNDMPSFVVTPVSNYVDMSSGFTEEHSVDIKNVTNTKQDVSFVLDDENGNYPYNYVTYTIMKDNQVVKKGVVIKDKVLYKDILLSNENNLYKIVFKVSQKTINNLGGISISAKISFV